MSIPDELKRHRHWVNWKMADRGGKKTKIPTQPNGSPASSTDSSTWCEFGQLNERWDPGFVFSADDPYIGIDLDGCRDTRTGDLDPWAQEIVDMFQTYTEVSPSGTGVKMFGVADGFWVHKNKVELGGDGRGGKSPGIEVYDQGRYFAVTGQRIGSWEINPVDDALDWLANKHNMAKASPTVFASGVSMETPVVERASKYLEKMDPAISGSRGHDACFKAACAMVLGFGLSTDEAYQLLAMEYNPRCDPPWSERELRHKVDSAAKQPGQRGYLRDAQPDQWQKIVVRTPKETPRLEPEQEEAGPKIRHTTLESAAVRYLDDLESGKSLLYETGIPELDVAIAGGVAPGEMVIVAARPSHGKSAISLQMVHQFTRDGLPAVLLSEEMSAMAIGKRAIQFVSDVPEYQWKTNRPYVDEQLRTHFASRAEARIVESCGTAEVAVREIERHVDEMDAKVVVVDYIQLLNAKGGNRYEQRSLASSLMRQLASRKNIAIVCLAQLSREIEKRPKFDPLPSDLKETGQLEQDADVIIFGVWPHKVDPSAAKDRYRFYIGKNRNRAIIRPKFEVIFEPERQRLVECASEIEGVQIGPHEEFVQYDGSF